MGRVEWSERFGGHGRAMLDRRLVGEVAWYHDGGDLGRLGRLRPYRAVARALADA